MKIFILPLLLLFSFTASSQTVTLNLSQSTLEKAFVEIKRQTGFSFVYTRDQLQNAQPVTLSVTAMPLNKVLDLCFKGQPVTYRIEDKYIIVREKEQSDNRPTKIDITGLVINEKGEPIAGATVRAKLSNQVAVTDDVGHFKMGKMSPDEAINISSIGYSPFEVQLQSRSFIKVTLVPTFNNLDETIVTGYGKTTRRFNTGNIGTISKKDISQQPVSNPLGAMAGRVPGLVITQSNGLPGSNFNVQIRGQNSLKQGNQPLYIVDGVPYMLNTGTLSQVSIMDINNPLNSINPSDIESIEVLKDADAISIYGSQGANGVILITTKKTNNGKTSLSFNYYSGFGKVNYKQRLLNTGQYLTMRKEAFSNDGIAPDISSAPDLKLWDSTAFTDWQEVLIGGTSKTDNAQLSLSGGSESIQFLLSGNYYRETTVFPQKKPAQKGTARLNVSHVSSNRRFRVSASVAYSSDVKKLPFADLTNYIYLPPNTPAMRDSIGNVNWTNWTSAVDNPFAKENNSYKSTTNNLTANLTSQLQVVKGLILKLSAGLNTMQLDETMINPISAQRPSITTTGSNKYASNKLNAFIVEPQAEYVRILGKGKLDMLAGLSLQQRKQDGSVTSGSGYMNDDLVSNLSSAPLITASNSSSTYKYLAFFGRVNYIHKERYIINLNIRRDGSSRFGPANKFSNFGSVGAGWIFSSEKAIKDRVKWMNYGKLRGSYGISGNDQIGDYQYYDAWSATTAFNYQGSSGLLPTRLFNAGFQWERNRKFETGIDLGFFNNKLLVSACWFRNVSDNQLVNYKMPATTGFATLLKNLNARIENAGWEFTVLSKNIVSKGFEWTTSFNLSVPTNKLLAYPNLDISSDRYNYVIGQPLSIIRTLNYLGVDPQTGRYTFEDIDKDGVVSSPNDLGSVSFIGQRFYGGISNDLSYKGFQLSFLFQFVKQTGRDFAATFYNIPGNLGNQPTYVLDRWSRPGDQSTVQAVTSTFGSIAQAYYNYQASNGTIVDASFIRLKNLALYYTIPSRFSSRYHIDNLKLYVQGQNLFTLSPYRIADPESQGILSLPPLRVIAFGIQLNLK